MNQNSGKVKLDQYDRQILELLQRNGRMTNRELAQRISMSPSPTLERVKKLERAGIIQGYTALVDPTKVGIGIFTFVQVTLARHGKSSVVAFIEAVEKMPEVLECYHITGPADFLLKVGAKDILAYEDFILHKLTEAPGVQNLQTLVVLSTIKRETALPVLQNGGGS